MTRRRVLIAHGEAGLRNTAVTVARQCGHEVIGVADGESARLVLAARPHPAALVVDVALPGALGYELCEEIRSKGWPTVTILVASVYSKTAYKRQPGNLYGAADYVEQHHLVDQLPHKLERVLSGASGPQPPHTHRTDDREAAAIRAAGEGRLAFRYRDAAEGEERARNLARLLIADVMLYGGDAVKAWRDAGCPGDYPDALGADVVEARRLYELRVPPELASTQDFFGESLRAVFNARSEECDE